ncbi:hypothetical protein [Cytobacillus sp. FSL K6-0265]|uniref:hypothetical protein n=1 Tax=Cytobacillus sp. FSL K6-0265 TaxID=2921448 RepID=UPI0030FBB0C7
MTKQEYKRENERLRSYFLAKGLPNEVAEVMSEYEWEDATVCEMLGEIERDGMLVWIGSDGRTEKYIKVQR